MLTPGGGWDNEWQEIPGPEAVLIGAVQNPALRALQGKTLAQVAALRKTDPIDALFDLLIEDQAYTYVAVFGMSEPDVALALKQPWVSINNDSQGTAPDGLLGQEHPHPAGLRHVSPHPSEVRARGAAAHAGGCDPQVHARCRRSGCAWATAACSRRACGPTWWCSIRHSVRDLATFAKPNQLVGGDAVGAGERRPGDRGRQGDRRAAGAGAAGGSRGESGTQSTRRPPSSGSVPRAPLDVAACPYCTTPDSFPYARRRHLRNRPAPDRAGAHARAASWRR